MDGPAPPARERLLSLDVFRGLMVVAMMMVDWPGSWDTRFALFEHAEWAGVTAPDFIFPSFLFIMGVAVPFSLQRGEGGYGRILRRGTLLFLVGYLLNVAGQMPGSWDLGRFRILGVLQRFGLVYPLVAVAFLRLRPRQLVGVAIAILIGYWLLLTRVPVPGFGPPDLLRHPTGEVTPNLACWLDRLVLGHRVYEYPFDPEGILSTIPAVATGLLGVVAGEWLRGAAPREERANRLFAWGVALVVAGYFWGLALPLCKKLWSSSFVVFMGGFALLFLAALYWLVDVRGWRSKLLALPVWYGSNALAAIVIYSLIDDVTAWIPTGRRPDGTPYLLKDDLFDHLFRSWLPDRHASWVFSVVAVLLLGLLFRWFHRRRIFIRL
jgi:predicted acyltransferase